MRLPDLIKTKLWKTERIILKLCVLASWRAKTLKTFHAKLAKKKLTSLFQLFLLKGDGQLRCIDIIKKF
ncbi:MAG: hypothetical protein D8M61_08350 [Ignavibacteriae bacterium]|nr:hypothetical protein [Ignavibacteriota bacterium]